jgi:hypothetical protein
MNRIISLAKIMFAGLAIYLLIGIVKNIQFSIFYFFQTFKNSKNFEWESHGIFCLSILLYIAMIAAIIWFLIVRSEVSARKLIGRNIEDDKPLNINLTLTMAFRLVCVGVGLSWLRYFLYSFSIIIYKILQTIKLPNDSEMFSGGLKFNFSTDLIPPLLCLALAIYLICGAPQFVRWQVKKTLKLCGEK